MKHESTQESLIVELPEELAADPLIAGLPTASVPSLRSGALVPAIAIVLGALGGVSNAVQILVARHDLSELIRRLSRIMSRSDRSGLISVTLKVDGQEHRMRLETDDPDDAFFDKAMKILQSSRHLNSDSH